MKVARIVQIVLLLLLAGYLVLLHNANPTNLIVPFFLPLPPALVIALALLIGWLVGWLPARIALWRRSREIRRLGKRIAELEQHLPSYQAGRLGTPVIPDRDLSVTAEESESR